MLEYCFGRLREGKWAERRGYYLCIEGFLLHNRNLTEFFGNHGGLRVRQPQNWSPRTLSEAELKSIQDRHLLDSYHALISRYLGHCDGIRAEKDRDWKHIEMNLKMEPLLTNFRKLFPSRSEAVKDEPVLGPESVSTAATSFRQIRFHLQRS